MTNLITKGRDPGAKQKMLQMWVQRIPEAKDEKGLLGIMSNAYNEFLMSNLSAVEIAAKLKLPHDIVMDWSRFGKWEARRRNLVAELVTIVEQDHLKFIRDNRIKTANKLVTDLTPLAAKLKESIEAAIAANDSMAVRRYAEAMTAVLNPLMQVAGLNSPLTTSATLGKDGAGRDEGAGEKPQWNINASGPVTIVAPPKEPTREEDAWTGPGNVLFPETSGEDEHA